MVLLLNLLFSSNTIAQPRAVAFGPNLDSMTIYLDWTAPGNDGDSGLADVYDIRMSPVMLTEDNWDQAVPLPGTVGRKPQFAGNLETYLGNVALERIFIALKTADGVPNWSGISNVHEINPSIGINPPNGLYWDGVTEN